MPEPVVASPVATTEQPPAARRSASVDGVRALAALAVLVAQVSFHAMGNRGPFGGWLARLDVGVAVFFVLSAFLLYRPFARALLRGEPAPSVRHYLRRRLLRIVPAYWLVVVVAFLFVPALGLVLPTVNFEATPAGVTSVPLWSLLRFVTFTQVYWRDSLAGPFPQAWSLATQMAFYLLLPCLAWAVGRRAGGERSARLRRQWWVLGGLFAGAQVFRLAVVLGAAPFRDGAASNDVTQLTAWLPNHLDLFALGMALAVLVVEREDRGPGAPLAERLDRWFAGRWAAGLSFLAGFAVLTLCGYGLGLSRTDLAYGRVGEFTRHWSYLLVALAVVLPVVFGTHGDGAVRGFLASRPMQFLGRISYGIYLWTVVVLGRWVSAPGAEPGSARHPGQQFDVPFWPTLAWTLVGTIALAVLTWALVEQPWSRFRDRPLGMFRGGMWAIAVSSFAARIWSFGTVTKQNPGNGDPFYYHAQANMLADGVGFGEPIQWLTEGRFVASAIHPPLFTLWLTPASIFGARDFLSHKTMAAVAGVLVVVAAGLLGRRLAGDRAGLVAAVLVALAPNLWLIDGTLWPEGLYTATVGFALVLAYRWRDAPSFGRAALVGAAVGTSVLARGEAIFLLPFLCLPLAWTQRKVVGRWLLHAVVMGVAAGAVMAPWTIRNLLTYDRPVLVSTNSEEVLFYANCPDVYSGRLIGFWSFACQERVRAERVAQGLPADPPGDEAERAAGWGEMGREYLAENKRRVPAVAIARFTRVWELQHSDSNLDALVFEGRPRPWSERGLWVFRGSLVAGWLGFVVLRRRNQVSWPLLSMLVMTSFTAVAVYGHVRFRTVADFVLLVAAAVAIDAVLPGRRRDQATDPDPDPGAGNDSEVAPGGAEDGDDGGGPTALAAAAPTAAATAPSDQGDPTRPAWARRRPDLRSAAAVALVAVVFVLPMHTLFRYQGPPMEEGFMLVFPERLLAGDVPNKDFLHLYGPGSLWLLAAWYKLVGVSLAAERVFGAAQLAGIVFGMMALARPWGRKVATATGVVGVLLTTTAIGLTALAWDGAVALAVSALWVGLRARRWLTDAPGVDPEVAGRRADRLLVGSGILAGAALLFRPDVVIAVGIGTAAVLAGLGWARWRRWLLGAVPTVATFLVHVVMAGPGNVIRGMLLEPVFDLRGGRSLPRPPSPHHFDGALQKVSLLRPPEWSLPAFSSPRQAWVWFFLLPLASLFVVAVGWWRVRAEPEVWRHRVLLAVGLLGLGLLPQAFQRADTTHLAWVSCVTLAFLPAAIAEVIGRVRHAEVRRQSTAAAAALALAIPIFVIPHFTARNYLDLVQQTGQKDVFGFPVSHKGRTFYLGARDIAPAAQAVVEDLDELSEPGERLFVGTADLRKTPYSDAYLYFLLPDLVPGTRYIEMDPGMANAEGSGLAEDVASSDWLILSHVWDAWEEPNTSRDFGSDEPNKVVERDFCLVDTYGRPAAAGAPEPTPFFVLYRRCR